MKEFELRQPVAKWLLSRGLIPILECGSLRNCDMVGVRFNEENKLVHMVAVELKLTDIRAVMKQCLNHVGLVSEVWLAMPTKRAKVAAIWSEPCEVGVLAIDEGACTQLIDADLRPCVNLERWRRPMWARRKEHLWRMNHPLMFRFGTHVPSKARERREAGQ